MVPLLLLLSQLLLQPAARWLKSMRLARSLFACWLPFSHQVRPSTSCKPCKCLREFSHAMGLLSVTHYCKQEIAMNPATVWHSVVASVSTVAGTATQTNSIASNSKLAGPTGWLCACSCPPIQSNPSGIHSHRNRCC